MKTKRTLLIVGVILLFILTIWLLAAQVAKHQQQQKKIVSPLPQHSALVASPSATIAPSGVTVLSNAKCTIHYVNGDDAEAIEPDPNCTPGDKNLAVTQATIHQTICSPGYTTIIRKQKSVSYFEKLKKQGMIDYGFIDKNIKHYEEDHFIPLELGGSNSPKNLWPEYDAGKVPNKKDKLENYLHTQVCANKVTLVEAQREIVHDWYWTSVYFKLQ